MKTVFQFVERIAPFFLRFSALPHQNRPLPTLAILRSLTYKDAATRIQGCR